MASSKRGSKSRRKRKLNPFAIIKKARRHRHRAKRVRIHHRKSVFHKIVHRHKHRKFHKHISITKPNLADLAVLGAVGLENYGWLTQNTQMAISSSGNVPPINPSDLSQQFFIWLSQNPQVSLLTHSGNSAQQELFQQFIQGQAAQLQTGLITLSLAQSRVTSLLNSFGYSSSSLSSSPPSALPPQSPSLPLYVPPVSAPSNPSVSVSYQAPSFNFTLKNWRANHSVSMRVYQGNASNLYALQVLGTTDNNGNLSSTFVVGGNDGNLYIFMLDDGLETAQVSLANKNGLSTTGSVSSY